MNVTRTAFIAVLEELMSVPPGTLKGSDTRASVQGWSSLVDVQILSLISEQFGHEMDSELFDYESIDKLLDALDDRQAFTAR